MNTKPGFTQETDIITMDFVNEAIIHVWNIFERELVCTKVDSDYQ
jgi:hypothetical protein